MSSEGNGSCRCSSCCFCSDLAPFVSMTCHSVPFLMVLAWKHRQVMDMKGAMTEEKPQLEPRQLHLGQLLGNKLEEAVHEAV
jgi:hypothetical protein